MSILTQLASEKKVQPMHIDGALHVAIGLLTAFNAGLALGHPERFLGEALIWWLQLGGACLLAAVSNLKAFRSLVYGDYRKEKHDTEVLTRNGLGLPPKP